MSKPNTEKCKKCRIINNIIRCGSCKWKTQEWYNEQRLKYPVLLIGEHDNYLGVEECRK